MKQVLMALAVWVAVPVLAARESADHVPLPDVAANPGTFKANLPLVRDKLGGTPEGLGARLFSVEKSRDLLAKHVDPAAVPTAWFGWGFAGADAFGVDLSDGVVSRVVLVYSRPQASRGESVERQLAMTASKMADGSGRWMPKPSPVNGIPFRVETTPTSVSFEVDRVELYVANHKPGEAIAAAMRQGQVIRGMTLDQVTTCFGEPDTRETNGSETAATWRVKGKEPAKMRTGTMTAEEYQREVDRVAATPPREVTTRILTVRMQGGVVVDVTDRRL